MKMSSVVGVCGAMALCLAVGTAQAGPNPGAASKTKVQSQKKLVAKKTPRAVVASPATRVSPTKVAGIRNLGNGKYQMTTEWIPFNGGGTDAQDTLAYDSMQVDPSGLPYGGGECGIPEGSRWLLEYTPGTFDFQNAFTTSNMTVPDEFAGGLSGRTEALWYWNDNGGECFIAVFTAEDVSIDCVLPSSDNGYDGIVFGFGAVPTGFYYFDADTSADGLFLQLPMDGTGAHTIVIADAFDGTVLTLAAGPTQPGLWGTSNNGGIPGRPGESTDPTWSDVNTDAAHTEDECFTYAYGVCPDPFTNTLALWTEGGGGNECYADCDLNGVKDFFDFLCFLNAFDDEDPYADCEANGIFDFFDFLCFLNEFDAQC